MYKYFYIVNTNIDLTKYIETPFTLYYRDIKHITTFFYVFHMI